MTACLYYRRGKDYENEAVVAAGLQGAMSWLVSLALIWGTCQYSMAAGVQIFVTAELWAL